MFLFLCISELSSAIDITTTVIWTTESDPTADIVITSTGHLIVNQAITFKGLVTVNAGGKLTSTEQIRFNKELEVSGTCIFNTSGVIEFDDIVRVSDGILTLDNRGAIEFKDELNISGTTGGAVTISYPSLFSLSLLYFHDINIHKGSLTLNNQDAVVLGNIRTFNIGVGSVFINHSIIDQSSVTKTCIIDKDGLLKIDDNSDVTMKAVTIIEGLLEIYDNSELSLASLTLTSSSTLNIDHSTIQVESGKTVSVDESTLNIEESIFKMGQNSEIVVQSSCESEINASHNSSFENTNPNESWKGIKIIKSCSTSLSTQFLTNPSIGSTGNCTKADWAGELAVLPTKIIMNNSTFKNAQIGINADGDELAGNNIGGAVVRLRECNFINCEKGVRIAGFYKDKPNASYIMTCNFEWNNDLPTTFTKTDLRHIELFALDNGAVNIGGCHFKNLNTEKLTANEKGTGIFATKSSFNVSFDGDKCCGEENGPCPDNCFEDQGMQSRRNVFEKLGVGIAVDLSLTTRGELLSLPTNKFACRNADFTNCIVGIKIEKGRDVLIGLNNFSVDQSDIDANFDGAITSPNIIGVSLKNSSGNRIYENVFTAIDNNFEYVVGIRSESPDLTQTSFIRANTFTNPTTVTSTYSPENVRAIDLYGNNNYLDITCNTFQNQVFDVRVNTGASLNDLPDMTAHSSNEKFSANSWSTLPHATFGINPPWMTAGNSSNVFNEVNNITIYDGDAVGDNMRFANNSYSKVLNIGNTLFFSISECGDNECVDCNTNCDKLEITKVPPVIGIAPLNAEKNGLLVYPNPANNNFTISLSNTLFFYGIQLSIYDLKGSLLYNAKLNSNTIALNTEELNLSNGTYVIALKGSAQTIHQKIVIIK